MWKLSSLSAAVPLPGEGGFVLSTGSAARWTERRRAGDGSHYTWMGSRGLTGLGVARYRYSTG